MNNYIFIILITVLIVGLFINSNKIKFIQNMENMKNCALNDKNVLDNPIFKELKTIPSHKFFKYISDFKNNVIDDEIKLKELLDSTQIDKLQNIINSYRVSDPVFNITLSQDDTIKNVKNIILKTIILNHLLCFGDNDPHIFWTKLHLMNKEYTPFNKDIKNNPIIKMFKKSKKSTINDNSKIISFYKHQQNITQVIIKKHPIIKTILKDYSLLYQNKLQDIILLILNKVLNNDDKKQLAKFKKLYLDLRELILINQLMKNNPNYHFGYSNNNKTFIFNHKIFIDSHKKIYDKLLTDINTFEELFNKHSISTTDKKYIRNIFLLKVKTYLKYNGIKLDNNDQFILLDINSINLKHLPPNKFYSKEINTEFISIITNKKKDDKYSFRIKQSDIYKETK